MFTQLSCSKTRSLGLKRDVFNGTGSFEDMTDLSLPSPLLTRCVSAVAASTAGETKDARQLGAAEVQVHRSETSRCSVSSVRCPRAVDRVDWEGVMGWEAEDLAVGVVETRFGGRNCDT